MINWEKTYKKYGYLEKELAKSSTNPVIWECEHENCQAPDCHRIREYPYSYALDKRKKAQAEGKPELCQTCAHLPRRGVKPNKTKKELPALPPQVNEKKTFEYYGYHAKDLPPWSKKKIVLDCNCGAEKETSRSQMNLSQAVKETGNYKCTACWTSEMRKGKKATAETKELMKQSQAKRRVREVDNKEKEHQTNLEEVKRLHKEYQNRG